MREFRQIAAARPKGTDAVELGDVATWVVMRENRVVARFIPRRVEGKRRMVVVLANGTREECPPSSSLGSWLERVTAEVEKQEAARA